VLGDFRDEEGLQGRADWSSIVNKIGATQQDFGINYDVLLHNGYIEKHGGRGFKITNHGYGAVEEHREAVKHVEEFTRLKSASNMLVTEREAALVALISSKCLTDGWQSEMVALEADATETLIFYRELNFFLSMSVWTDEELSRVIIRTLRQQVASRPGTYGCVFSMSPVSAEAISEAQMHLETACIIIFGEDDLTELFHGGTLVDAVNTKMVNARVRRSIQAK